MRTETELKFLVMAKPREGSMEPGDVATPDPSLIARALRGTGYCAVAHGGIVHKDRYYDDARLSLARSGFALRRRMREGQVIATLKTLGTVRGARHERGELEVPLDRDASAWDAWPDAIDQYLRTVCDPRSLKSLMELVVTRHDVAVARDGHHVATVSLDAVTAARPNRPETASWLEIEIEHASNGADETRDELAAIAASLASHLHLEPSGITKLERARQRLMLHAS